MSIFGNHNTLSDIIRGGRAAQQQHRSQRHGNGNDGPDLGALDPRRIAAAVGGTAIRQAHQQSLIDQLARAFAQSSGLGGDYGVSFGQHGTGTGAKRGKYQGFQTEGELKSAIEGRGAGYYQDTQSQADQLANYIAGVQHDQDAAYQKALHDMQSGIESRVKQDRGPAWMDANGHYVNLDRIARQVNESDNAVRQGTPDDAAQAKYLDTIRSVAPGLDDASYQKALAAMVKDHTPTGMRDQRVPDMGDVTYGDLLRDPTGYGLHQGDVAYADRGSDYGWLGGSHWGKMLDKVAKTTARDETVGPDYGKALEDWHQQNGDNADAVQEFVDQMRQVPYTDFVRLAATRDYGIDPNLAAGWFDPAFDNSYMTAARNQQSWAENGMPYGEAQTTARNDQKASDQAAEDQANAMFDQDSYDITGMSGQELSSAVNIAPEQLAPLLHSDEFAQADQDAQFAISKAVDDGNPTHLVDLADAYRQSPEIWRILKAKYGDSLDPDTYAG